MKLFLKTSLCTLSRGQCERLLSRKEMILVWTRMVVAKQKEVKGFEKDLEIYMYRT